MMLKIKAGQSICEGDTLKLLAGDGCLIALKDDCENVQIKPVQRIRLSGRGSQAWIGILDRFENGDIKLKHCKIQSNNKDSDYTEFVLAFDELEVE